MKYAIIENGHVTNVVLASASMGPNWVQSDAARVGDLYDGKTFTAPVVEPAAPLVVRELSKIEYLKRFTQEERIAIRTAAKVNPVAEDYVELMNAAPVIHMDDEDTIAGLQTLEAAGLLGKGRAAEILK